MSTPRLILKQPTGWFAAGREFAQAITLLSDGAFKLYVYACLRAGRHTGCLRATVEELARAVETTPSVIAMNVDELEERAVCCVRRDQSPQLVLQIHDHFWPYQRQLTTERPLGPETEFVDRVRGLFLAPACVQASFSAADGKLANPDHQPAILRRHRRGSEGIGDTGKLLEAASIEDGTDGTTMAERKSGKSLMPKPAGQPRLPCITNQRPT